MFYCFVLYIATICGEIKIIILNSLLYIIVKSCNRYVEALTES